MIPLSYLILLLAYSRGIHYEHFIPAAKCHAGIVEHVPHNRRRQNPRCLCVRQELIARRFSVRLAVYTATSRTHDGEDSRFRNPPICHSLLFVAPVAGVRSSLRNSIPESTPPLLDPRHCNSITICKQWGIAPMNPAQDQYRGWQEGSFLKKQYSGRHGELA